MFEMPRMQTRLAAKKALTFCQTHNMSTCSTVHEDSKEDQQGEANLVTFQKPKNQNKSFKNCAMQKPKKSRPRVRSMALRNLSKLQFYFSLEIESLLLAIDIYDDFMAANDGQIEQKPINVALVCFMLALKFREVYPPPLEQVQYRMESSISFKDYMELEAEVIEHFNFNLNLESPFSHMQNLGFQLTQEKRTFYCQYLELAALTRSIRGQYTWKETVEAITALLVCHPGLQDPGSGKLPQRIVKLAENLRLLRSNFEYDLNEWLDKKYWDPKSVPKAAFKCTWQVVRFKLEEQ